jgi:hypothetical protein
MIELLMICVFALVCLAALVALPLLLLGVLLKCVLWLVLLPFRILAGLVGLAASAAGLLLKGFVLLVMLLLGAGLFLGGIFFLLLAPLALVGLAIWLVARLFGPSAAVAGA